MNENKYTVGRPVPYENKIEYLPLEKRDMVFAVIFLVISILLSGFGFFNGFFLGYCLSAMLFLVLCSVYVRKRGKKLRVYNTVCGILAAACIISFIFTTNSFVRIWTFIVSFVLGALWLDGLVCDREEHGDLGLLRNVIYSTFGISFSNLRRVTASLFAGENVKKKQFLKVLIGVACAIPVLFIIIPLLISSDFAFESLMLHVVDDLQTAIIRLVIGVALAPFLISYAVMLRSPDAEAKADSKGVSIDKAYIISFLSVISVCYIVYLFSQLAYFFSAFSGILPKNYAFSVSEYARRGFFEMSAIAIINFILVSVSVLLSEKRGGKPGIFTRILCVFICLFTLTIIATALSKMFLYISEYGMTVLRISTSSFMIFLAVVFVVLIIRCFSGKIPVLRIALMAASVVVLTLSFGNIDRFIADYNYNAYKSGTLSSIDVSTISELGYDGVEHLIDLTYDSNASVANQAKTELLALENRYYALEDGIRRHASNGFAALSLPREKMYALFDEYLDNN